MSLITLLGLLTPLVVREGTLVSVITYTALQLLGLAAALLTVYVTRTSLSYMRMYRSITLLVALLICIAACSSSPPAHSSPPPPRLLPLPLLHMCRPPQHRGNQITTQYTQLHTTII